MRVRHHVVTCSRHEQGKEPRKGRRQTKLLCFFICVVPKPFDHSMDITSWFK